MPLTKRATGNSAKVGIPTPHSTLKGKSRAILMARTILWEAKQQLKD